MYLGKKQNYTKTEQTTWRSKHPARGGSSLPRGAGAEIQNSAS